ncbi:putative DUF924-domain-containing protein [Seiridium cardinale]
MNPDAERIVAFWFDLLKPHRNEIDNWVGEPEGSLALVVLLDQFSRNMFRSTPDALSADAKASETATKAIAQDSDKQVTVIQASAFYMPLIQRESLISVIAARCLFEALMARYVSKEERDWVDMGITASKKHIQQLERFGRYPTRNAVLGRRNTEAEDEFSEECVPNLK